MNKFFIIFGSQYLFIIGVLIFLTYFAWLWKKKKIVLRDLVFGFLALVVTYVTAKIIGHFYLNPRPFAVEHFIPLVPHIPDNGFPSDHTLLVSSLAAILYTYHKKLGITVFLIAILVGISRVYAGVHHPVDIIGAMAIAIFASFISYFLIVKLK